MANYLTPANGRPAAQLGGTRSKTDVQHVEKMYKTRIYNRPNLAGGISISGYTPEDFAINIMANWDEPLAGMSDVGAVLGDAVGGPLGGILSSGLKLSGRNANIAGSSKVWQGGSSLSFELPMKISAYDDTTKEIMTPLKRVLKLCTPFLDTGGMLIAPGPNPIEFSKILLSAGNISGSADNWQKALEKALTKTAFYLEIGTFFKMFPCVITNVSAQFNGMFEEGTGFPTSIELNLTVESYLTPTSYDIDNWVLGGES